VIDPVRIVREEGLHLSHCIRNLACQLENGGAKVGRGSGGMSLLRAA
jgi:hypothetical protein